MEDPSDIPEALLPSLGEKDFASAKFDYQITADIINRSLDAAEERLNAQ